MRWLLGFLMLALAAKAAAQPAQTRSEALAEDAIQYAAQFGITPDEAFRRLTAQQDSVPATDAIAREFVAELEAEWTGHLGERRMRVLREILVDLNAAL